MTTEKKHAKDTTIERDICAALDQTLTLDDATQTRLATIRQRALAELPARGSKRPHTFWLMSASGAVVCAVLAIMLLLPRPHPNIDNRVAELEWLINDDDLPMLEAEFEFYEWADSELDNAG